MYPRIKINLNKIEHNTKTLVQLCKEQGITSIFGVTKVIAGDLLAASAVVHSGITHIAESRVENLKTFVQFDLPKVLLRLPMKSEIVDVVKYADISLNSEIETIKELNEEAFFQNKVHQIILMFDLGDLREGIWFESKYLPMIEQILSLKNIHLLGIGTNLTCYGGVIPNHNNLNQLIQIKNTIENKYKIELEIVSGGNTSSLHLIFNNNFLEGINNLRLGEGIFLGRETSYCEPIKDLYQDVFTLEAQIIELKEKPSVPIGEIGVDAFGQKPTFKDKGMIKRAILAIGRQDVQPDNIFPLDKNIEIIGSSSDHLLIDVTHSDYKLGDVISFGINYGGLLQLMTSNYVKKEYVRE